MTLESSVGIFRVQLIFAITGQPNKELVGVWPGLIKGKGNYGRNRFYLFPQVERIGRNIYPKKKELVEMEIL